MYETIKVLEEDWGYTLLLNRSEKMNALSYKMIREIHHALEHVKKEAPHVLLIRGEGVNFCSGHDLNDSVADASREENEERIVKMQEITGMITDFPAPVIAAVQGYAIGAGSEIALNCDLIYATEDSVFNFPELKLGLSITQGASYFLPRQVGLAKAKEFLFFGEKLSAMELKNLGVINDIFPSDDFELKVLEKVQLLKKQDLAGLVALKKLLHYGMAHDLTNSLAQEVLVLKSLLMK